MIVGDKDTDLVPLHLHTFWSIDGEIRRLWEKVNVKGFANSL
jgi:hypothetical protein